MRVNESYEMASAQAIRSYAGIGSRKTPPAIMTKMTSIAAKLHQQGWVLRSGGADGADSAFAAGVPAGDFRAEIYLPWAGFNRVERGIDATRLPVSQAAAAIAEAHHPAWSRLSASVKALLARNAHQILGANLDDPVRMVVCWAEGSRMDGDRVVDTAGGTGLAVRIAATHGIPVRNLALGAHDRAASNWLDEQA